jgi:uncharacterized protein DUF6799
MKTNNSILLIALTCSLMAGHCHGAVSRAERVLFRDGLVWAVEPGKTTLLEEELELPNSILVKTNGTFQVGRHSPRAFAEGQILRADGMLISPNGRIEPVIDYVGLEAGATIFSVNGDENPVNRTIQLGKDKWLTSERELIGSDGSWMRVIDGQLFTPEGKTIPAVDTITLHEGKVIVQKEGTQLVIGSDRSMMMNEGTKVFGNGQVRSTDLQITQLTEGQLLTIEGVVKLR